MIVSVYTNYYNFRNYFGFCMTGTILAGMSSDFDIQIDILFKFLLE